MRLYLMVFAVSGLVLLGSKAGFTADADGSSTEASTVWPDASNTGPPAGAELRKTGSLVITKEGTVISDVDVRGTVQITASDVTLRRCRVSAAAYHIIQIASTATGVVVEDCTIDGTGAGNSGSNGILGTGIFRRNNISLVENGITLNGSNTLIEGNYIHSLKASGSPHYDGIQIDGGVSNVTIRGNTIINENGDTSAIMIDNYFGPISDIIVQRNLLVGGGYTVYSDGQFEGGDIKGVVLTQNRLGRGGWGYTMFRKNKPVFAGNVFDGAALVRRLNR